MTEQEELIKLRALLAEKEQLIADQNKLIEKQRIQIENDTGTASCTKKNLWNIF